MSSFVHLHVHSEYSLLDGAARTAELVKQASAYGMKALALTDHGVMYGAIPFYRACVENGIKPIIGCEAYMTAGSRKERGSRKDQPIYHLILLAKNKTGYQNLMKLCSIGHLEGFHYKPRIDMEALAAHHEGIICLSACLGGEVPQHLLHGREAEARRAAERYRNIFGDDFYLELQDHGLSEQKRVNPLLIALAKELDIPLVATNDVHYLTEPDADVQDVLICIGTGKTVDDEERLRIPTRQLYLKSQEDMARLFPHVAEAIDNTVRIAEKCELELEFGQSILPEYRPLPEGMTPSSYLRSLCVQGLERRYGSDLAWEQPGQRERLEQRLSYELNTIDSMGFSDYFLIVWDFIAFAHKHNIATGPGRGSSAGSLVAYVLHITNVDPMKYNLLFERFLNPERISMPDIDIDFSDERRDEVIDYVVQKYGNEHVAQIITFGTLAARAAVRDVGRALNVPYGEVDKAAKLIPAQLGINIRHALEITPELKTLYETKPKTRELLDMAIKVEGMPRHASTHAAGVVISRTPLTDAVPLQEGSEGVPLTQYSMENLERIGLLKMDFLGLRTLSIIERCMRWITEEHGETPDFSRIPDNDPHTYDMLGKGDTGGVFQLESAGVRRVLKDLKPSVFEDIISVLALYRPGPMGFIPNFIQAKHGEIEVHYPHPDLEPILKDTYGIIVYQEQIMQIASRMAGFSLGEADLLRRAVSKKKREVLDLERGHFVEGSVKQGYTEEEAGRVYDMIVRFADYGFPRAHAAAYGVLAFQTAYLKAHYPVQFMASMLTAVMGSHRKVAEYVVECRRMDMAVLPPDVNESGVLFTPLQQGNIRFGLAAIKNVGTQAMESILAVRKERPFDSLLDFCRRVDLRVCNKRVIESLIQAGAFDSLPGHRAQLIAMLDETVDAAVKWRKERDDLQIDMFGFVEMPNWDIEYPEVPKFSAGQQLELERELLGLYLSGHPLDDFEPLLESSDAERLMELGDVPDEAVVVTAGMVVSLKTITTKQGKAMAFIELEDQIERCEVVLFPEVWKRSHQWIEKGALLAFRAKMQHQDEHFKLLADEAAPLAEDSLARLLQRRRAGARSSAAAGKPASAAGSAAGGPGGGAPRVPSRPSAAESSAQPTTAPAVPPVSAARPATDTSPHVTEAANGEQAPAPRGSEPTARQRVFVKITRQAEEDASLLVSLKALLQEHPGALPTVLFYESSQRLLALSDAYSIKPSPQLFDRMESMLGAGTVKVK
ncbi:DNA polymerase III subunit alpha [Paenibacillus terrae HPL-003]|uniref:DNA-directed DNA polymerase n=1 Tax=Paenibacillus terrae (strain HPL-003) TaxID=985665 RepID=G7W0N9_PAETH|nr:DNA polymerase III subunit alpha [Paenibacillus terrae]AET59976.1 DNA polymerase III subunit alpha [Paenibacillus terrae HPL-003]